MSQLLKVGFARVDITPEAERYLELLQEEILAAPL